MEWLRRELERMRKQATGSGRIILKDGSTYLYDSDRVLAEVVRHAGECARRDYYRQPRSDGVPEIFEKIAQARDRRKAILAIWTDLFRRTTSATPGPFTGVDLVVLEAEGRITPRLFAPGYPPVEEAS